MKNKKDIYENISLKRLNRIEKKINMTQKNIIKTKNISTQTDNIIETKQIQNNFTELIQTDLDLDIHKIEEDFNKNIYKLKLFQLLLNEPKIKFNNYQSFNRNQINQLLDTSNFNLNNNSLFLLDDFSIVFFIENINNHVKYKYNNINNEIIHNNINFQVKINKINNNFQIKFLNYEFFLSNIKYFFIKKN